MEATSEGERARVPVWMVRVFDPETVTSPVVAHLTRVPAVGEHIGWPGVSEPDAVEDRTLKRVEGAGIYRVTKVVHLCLQGAASEGWAAEVWMVPDRALG